MAEPRIFCIQRRSSTNTSTNPSPFLPEDIFRAPSLCTTDWETQNNYLQEGVWQLMFNDDHSLLLSWTDFWSVALVMVYLGNLAHCSLLLIFNFYNFYLTKINIPLKYLWNVSLKGPSLFHHWELHAGSDKKLSSDLFSFILKQNKRSWNACSSSFSTM